MKKLIAVFILASVVGLGAFPTVLPADDEAAPVVLITGANRGLGLEFARQYSEAGWEVIGTARKPDAATDLNELGVSVVQLDVTDAECVARMAAELEGQPIDLLINNAGVLPMVETLPDADIDQIAHQVGHKI